jgi:hypothetical protein
MRYYRSATTKHNNCCKSTLVAKKKHKPVRQRRSPNHRDPGLPHESRAAEAMTVAWTVSVTGVVISDLVLAAASFYARTHPSQPTKAFAAIMLMSAAAMGAVSLALLPVVWRTRVLKPPIGYSIFAVLVAAAPVAVLVSRLLP